MIEEYNGRMTSEPPIQHPGNTKPSKVATETTLINQRNHTIISVAWSVTIFSRRCKSYDDHIGTGYGLRAVRRQQAGFRLNCCVQKATGLNVGIAFLEEFPFINRMAKNQSWTIRQGYPEKTESSPSKRSSSCRNVRSVKMR